MEPKQKPPTIQELARQMMRKLEDEAASEPDGMLASHIAMRNKIDEMSDRMEEDSLTTGGGDSETDSLD